MSGALRRFAFFWLGVVLVAVPMLAFSETIPATSSGTSMIIVWRYQDAGHTDPDALCHLVAAAATAPSMYSYIGISDSTIVSGMKACKWIQNDANKTTTERTLGRGWICPGKPFGWGANPASENYGGCTPVYTCPANQGWTLSGTTCSREPCPSGWTRDATGTCVNNCSVLAGTGNSYWTGQQYCDKGSLLTAPSVICENGCQMALGGVGVGTSTYWCQQVGKYTGEPCSTNSPAGSGTSDGVVDDGGEKLPTDSPEKKCVDQGLAFGTVNGVVVCTDPTSSKGTKTKTETEKDAAGNTTGSKTTKVKTETVKNPDGSTTTTTTTTNADGTTTVVTETKEGEGSGGGVGKGDPQFSAPKAGEFKGKTSDIDAAKRAVSEKFAQVKAEAKSLIGTMTTGAGSLPCDGGVSAAGGTVSLCFSKYQEQIKAIPAAILLLGALTAVFIIFR